MKPKFLILTLLATGLWATAAASSDTLGEYLSMIENSSDFTDAEKDFARSLIYEANGDDSLLDMVLKSPHVPERSKQLAKNFLTTGKEPDKIRYRDPAMDPDFELRSPPTRFHGDLSLRLQDIYTRNDISDYFQLNNAHYYRGFESRLEGQIRWAPEVENAPTYGYLDLRVRTRDPETEIVNAYMHNRENWYAAGTYLEPYTTEFGLKNTEITGFAGHFEWLKKWRVDLIAGETVEDYVTGLNGLETMGFYLTRDIGRGGADRSGLSYYYANDVHYYGLTQDLKLYDGLTLHGEYMQRESTTRASNRGGAWEFELDYEKDKVLWQNEYQRITPNFSSTLNPEFTYLTGVQTDRVQQESSFTYRFDPWVASSATFRQYNLDPVGIRPEISFTDYTWTLSTQRPGKPIYMVVLKGNNRDDGAFTVDENNFIGMGRTVFKNRDLITSVEFLRTDHNDKLQPRLSYLQHAMGVEFSRPFMKRLKLKERIRFIDSQVEDPTLSHEALSHHLQARYQVDQRTTLTGEHRYRRVTSTAFPDKYKIQLALEARRRIDENSSYSFRAESFNYDEFGRGYDARLFQAGMDFSF